MSTRSTTDQQQLTSLAQELSRVVKAFELDESMEAKQLVAQCNNVLALISKIGKSQNQNQFQAVGGAAFLYAHERCCSVCSKSQVNQLLSRFIRN